MASVLAALSVLGLFFTATAVGSLWTWLRTGRFDPDPIVVVMVFVPLALLYIVVVSREMQSMNAWLVRQVMSKPAAVRTVQVTEVRSAGANLWALDVNLQDTRDTVVLHASRQQLEGILVGTGLLPPSQG